MAQPVHTGIHFWRSELGEPPCGTLEDRFDWSDAVDDVTCEGCLEALAGDSGDLTTHRRDMRRGGDDQEPAAP